MAHGFFRGKASHRQRTLLDLPRDILDSSGVVVKSAFGHYTRTLLEWARDITQQVEGRSVIRQEWWDSTSAAYTGDDTTDMTIPDVDLIGGWFYGIHMSAPVTFAVAGGRTVVHLVELTTDKYAGRFADIDGDTSNHVNGWVWFVPPRSGRYSFAVTLDRVSGAGNLTFAASDNIHRELTLVGFGPAPAAFIP